MTRVALYARYSSDRQNERSVGDQVAVLTALAERRGWSVVQSHMDAAISGTAMANRPGLLNALAAAERGEFDCLLVEDEDRIARDEEHQWHVYNRLAEAGVFISTMSSERVSRMEVAFKSFMAAEYVQVLSTKTKRGMRANAERGAATGSKLFGYVSAPGGATTIVESEAQVVRRILADYAAGATAREIAAALNAEGVPGPRGGLWNQSSINGSRQRGNGILNTEQYVGVKVWNRFDMRKDRTTGKRISRAIPHAEWKRTPVPELRIVDDATWNAVKARQRALPDRPEQARRQPGVFSGLLKCGQCGGSYTVYTGGKLVCATYREKGVCSNRRTPSRDKVEARVLDGLRDNILSPEAVALYVRTYHRAAQARKANEAATKAPLEKRLAEARRAIDRIVSAIERGVSTAPMEARMMELDAERLDLEAKLAAASEPPTVYEMHPGAADEYARMVATLRDTLAEVAQGKTLAQRQLIDAVRGLIDRIVITPRTQERGGPIDIRIEGTLARFMGEPTENVRSVALVAGGGIEPPTCGL